MSGRPGEEAGFPGSQAKVGGAGEAFGRSGCVGVGWLEARIPAAGRVVHFLQ